MSAAAPNLLLVEDDPIGAEWLLQTLRGWGLVVTHARDCAESLAQAALPAFAGLLLDQRLPDGAGPDLLLALRARGARAPAIALSADLDPGQRRSLLDHGFSECLRKPVEANALLDALRRQSLSPPTWDPQRALDCANGHAAIAASLRRLMIQELPMRLQALPPQVDVADLDSDGAKELDGQLHRLLGSARLTGATALAAQIEATRAALGSGANGGCLGDAFHGLQSEIHRLLREADVTPN